MDANNPWQVVSIEAFYCLKCPECMYFTTDDNGFYDHAVDNHPLSGVLFGKPNVETINPVEILNLLEKNELPENSLENEDIEILYEKTFEKNAEDCNRQIETETYETFSCKYCNESFSDLSDMKMHLKIHDKSILGQTNVLEKESFENPKTNKPENKQSSEKNGFGMPYNSIEGREYIPTVHEFKKQFKCSNCDASFKKRPSLKKHICNDKIGKQFQCEYCTLIFNSNVKMKYHISREHKNTHIDHPRGTSILGEVRHV